jgi:exopolysaccharide production protein ExoQ
MEKSDLIGNNLFVTAGKYIFHSLVILRLMGAFKNLFVFNDAVNVEQTSGIYNYFAVFILMLSFILLNVVYLNKLKIAFFKLNIYWLFLFYVFLSLFWSQKPFISFSHFISFCLVSFYSYLVYIQFDLKQFLRLLLSVILLALILSLLSVLFLKNIGIQFKWGELFGWNGIFTHKNHLGIFSAFIMLLGFELFRFATHWQEKILFILAIFTGFITLYGSKSISSLITIVLVLILMSFFRLLRKSPQFALCLLLVIIVCGFLVGNYVESNWDRLLGNYLSKESSLSGRTSLWRYTLPYAKERLFFGYGFNAFWIEKTAAAERIWSLMDNWQAGNAHNGYLELVLELGLSGLLLFLLIEIVFFINAIKTFYTDHEMGSFYLSFILFFLFANFMEAKFLNGFNFWWFLIFVLFLYLKNGKRGIDEMRHDI